MASEFSNANTSHDFQDNSTVVDRAAGSNSPISAANDRRRFLKTSLIASTCGLAGTLWQPVPAWSVEDQASEKAEPAKLTFVQINDLHVQAPLAANSKIKPTYKLANEKARWCIEAIANGPEPDFVLAIGDMAHGEQLDQVAKDLAEFKAISAPLKCPLYPVVGNHEVVQAMSS
jgi:2',3'-cyclic-nucleotide 2'-phosphodiesterase (5'-nucleotidase family)